MSASLLTARRLKKLLFITALIYFTSFASGYYTSYIASVGEVSSISVVSDEILDELINTVLTQPPFTTVVEALQNRDLASAILLTFTVNLAGGAFLTTTLIGVIPVLGVVAPSLVAFYRSFLVGLLYYGLLNSSPATAAVAVGTAVLELGAYVFSTAAGTNIALSILFPRRHNTESRKAAFKEAWKDAGRLFIIVVILLTLGAVWEMTGLYLLIH
ncbi:MAG: stage II sporulation protein M [Candidatus Bathyarchaeia archaeon]